MLQRRRFFQGRSIRGGEIKDIAWFEPGRQRDVGRVLDVGHVRRLGVRLAGTEIDETDEHGEPIVGETLFLMFSAHAAPIDFALPRCEPGQRWSRLLDTSLADWSSPLTVKSASYELAGRAVAVFRVVEPSSVETEVA